MGVGLKEAEGPAGSGPARGVRAAAAALRRGWAEDLGVRPPRAVRVLRSVSPQRRAGGVVQPRGWGARRGVPAGLWPPGVGVATVRFARVRSPA